MPGKLAAGRSRGTNGRHTVARSLVLLGLITASVAAPRTVSASAAAAEWAEFRFIRDEVGLSDSALSKQLTTLEEAGYVEIEKSFIGKRSRTSARLTKVGRVAFERHVAALQEIVARAGASIHPAPPK